MYLATNGSLVGVGWWFGCVLDCVLYNCRGLGWVGFVWLWFRLVITGLGFYWAVGVATWLVFTWLYSGWGVGWLWFNGVGLVVFGR